MDNLPERINRISALNLAQLPDNCTSEHRLVVLASKGNKLRKMPEIKVKEVVAIILRRAKHIGGQTKVNADERADIIEVMNAAVDVITREIIQGKYQGITAEQLELICTRGASGDYGDYYGINAKTLNEWIMKFREYESKFQRDQMRHMEKLNEEKHQQQRSEYYKANEITLLLARFREEYNKKVANPSYEVEDVANRFYYHLQEIGRLPKVQPEKQREKFKNQAKQKLKDFWLTESRNPELPKPVRDEMKNAIETIDTGKGDKVQFIKIVTGLILNDYLLQHIEMDSTFQDII